MRTINKTRAAILAKLYKEPENDFEKDERMMLDDAEMDCQHAVNGAATTLLQGTFSCKEETRCTHCDSSYEPRFLPIICVADTLKPKFENFVQSINENLPDGVCYDCQQAKEVEREFGNFLFIEVVLRFSFIYFFFISKIFLFCFQVPHERNSLLKDLLEIINIGNNSYSLCGVIIFEPPHLQGMLGHYKAAVKSFNVWTEYDDTKKNTHSISDERGVMICSILYLKLENETN